MTGAVKEKRRTKRRQHIVPSDYRTPMQIVQVRIFWNNNAFYVCPRCQVTLEREFQSYCDRCGQCLNWRGRKKAERIFIHWDGSRK